jgi:CO/xanthine dehydrogenase FAD-binding subunit
MIQDYRRPATLEEALGFLARTEMRFVPIGGGSTIDRFSRDPIGIVDLQDLGLGSIRQRGGLLEVGATATLQALLDTPGLQPDLGLAISLETAHNLRRAGTVAGTLVSADGRSPLATALLALDASLTLLPGDERVGLGELLALRDGRLIGRLITMITIPLKVQLSYASVARTPADRPIVCAALAAWPSGRTRAALGGWGAAPVLALDGPDPGGLEAAARNAYGHAGDEWGSAEYRQDVAGILVTRCLERISQGRHQT